MIDHVDPAHLARWWEVTRNYVLAVEDTWSAPRADSGGGRTRYLSRARGKLLRLLKQVRQRDDDPLAQLERLYQLQVRFIAQHPNVPRRLLGWLLQDGDTRLQRRVQGVIQHYVSCLARVIAEARRQGLIKADVPPQTAAALLVSVIQGLVLRTPAAQQGGEGFLREAAEAFALYRAGLGLGPAAAQ